MKTSLKNAIRFITFVTITFILVMKTGEVFIPEKSDKKIQGATYTIKGFYEMPKNSIDVLFVGDSSILNSVSPMEMWEKEGITAYNYSASSVRTIGLYYMVKEVLNTQKPKVLAIDPDTMFFDYYPDEPLQRAHIDYLKNKKVKLELANDPYYKFDFIDKVSVFVPLLRYHSRWQELSFQEVSKINKDFSSITRGFVMAGTVKPSTRGDIYMDKYNDSIKYENNSLEYLNKIYETCKENGVELMLIEAPNSRDWGKAQHEIILSYANEHNINFIDFNTVDFGLKWDEDTKDGGVHLNVVGAIKLSNYLTEYLKDNYDLEDHRKDAKYQFWQDDYEKYKKELNKYIKIVNDKIAENAKNNY